MQARSVLSLVVFLKATEHRSDVSFIEALAFLYGLFFAEFFDVACGESRHWGVEYAAEFATRIIVVHHIRGWIFLIVTFTVAAPHYVYAITFAIKKCINVRNVCLRLWPGYLASCWRRQRLVFTYSSVSVLLDSNTPNTIMVTNPM